MALNVGTELEQRWTEVDRWAEDLLDRKTDKALRKALETASRLAKDNTLVPAEVSPLQGKYLATQCQLIDAKHVLEVGTLGAYSTVWLVLSSPNVQVTSIEIDPDHKRVADQVIAEAGLRHRVDIRLGAAIDVLPQIREEVVRGDRPRFDFVFIDADKQNNLAYLDQAIQMCRSRACIIVDNVVRGGTVVDLEAAERDGKVRGTREVIEAVGADERVLSASLVQTVGVKGYDGFMIAVVK